MNEQLNNILFWVSFVGVAIFIVNSIYATIVLRHVKDKQLKAPDFMFTAVVTTMAIMFTALAISMHLKKTEPTPAQSITRYIELHQPAGKIFQYNPLTKKMDTVEIFVLKK